MESCLISNFFELLSQQKNDGDASEEISCGAPTMNETEIQFMFEGSKQMCTYSGVFVNSEEIEGSMTEIDSLFGAENCWTSLCTDVENIVEDTINDGLDELVNGVVSGIAECADIELDPNSCLVSTSFGLILSQISGDYYDATGEDDGFNRKLFEQYYDDDETFVQDICQAPDIDLEELYDIINAAQYICISSGDTLATEDAEEVKTAIASLLGANPCWSDLCTELEGNANDLMALMLTYVMDCASVDLSSTSCSDVSFLDLFSSEVRSSSSRLLTTSQNVNVTETECIIPTLHYDAIKEFVSITNESCTSNGFYLSEEELDDMKRNFETLSTSEKCWTDLCSEDAAIILVSNALEGCANADFPTSMTNPTEVALHPDNYIDDRRLACMLEFAISSQEVSFGFDPLGESGESCLPFVGATGIGGICSSIIGPAAIDHCPATYEPNQEDDLVWPTDDLMSMSFSFDSTSVSMSYAYGDETGDKTFELIDSMCSIFEALVGEEGHKCLEPFCDLLSDAISTREIPSEPPQFDDDDPSTPSSSVPSLSPVASSSSPSHEISLSPFGLTGVSTVEIKFEAGITLNNIRLSDIPNQGEDLTAMVKVLENVISKFLPPGALARILRIGSISVDRRLLRKLDDSGGVKVAFEVTMKSECDDDECVGAQDIADDMYDDVKETINGAVSSGDLTSAIKEEALQTGVEALRDVSIDENSFEAKEKLVKVEKKNVKSDDDTKEDDNIDDSSSKILHFRFHILFLLVALDIPLRFI